MLDVFFFGSTRAGVVHEEDRERQESFGKRLTYVTSHRLFKRPKLMTLAPPPQNVR